jgi:hypothetical protein
MFEVYFDDSGTDSQSPLAIAACYISTKRGWNEFTEAWKRIGSQEGFDTFHMADFAAKSKPFDTWDGDKRKRVYNRLAKTINDNKWVGFGIAIPKDVFDRVVPSLPEPVRTKCGKHHFTFVVKAVLTMIVAWRVEFGIKSPMNYIFDRMAKGRGEIKKIWDDIDHYENQLLERLGIEPHGFSFQNKECFHPLQAADILAWQMNWHVRNVIGSQAQDVEDCHANFRTLRLNQHMRLAFMTEANFMSTIQKELDKLDRGLYETKNQGG